ncbi:MAG: histidine triad nucleotide-binding protein [Planctomycetota bacterium]|jgi:histidine triad (HIT) family protein
MNSDCIFCKIVNGDIPADKVYEDDLCIAFRDLNPQAPVHLLLIPKEHIARLDDLNKDHSTTAGHLLCKAGEIAKEQGLSEDGFRTVINCGKNAGQEVFHIHLHIMGGRPFTWPAG